VGLADLEFVVGHLAHVAQRIQAGSGGFVNMGLDQGRDGAMPKALGRGLLGPHNT
jgi:hypothetical protein